MKEEDNIVSKSVPNSNPFVQSYKGIESGHGNRFSFDPTPYVKQAEDVNNKKRRSKSKKKKAKQITKEYVSSPPASQEDNAISIKSPEDQIRDQQNFIQTELAKLKEQEMKLLSKQDSVNKKSPFKQNNKFESAPTTGEEDIRIRMSLVTSGSSQLNSHPYGMSFANKIDPVVTQLI